MATRSIQIAAGTVAGAAHRAAGRNNQDAFAWAKHETGLAAVVSDGCGSGAHSEIGAQLGARLFVEQAVGLCGHGLPPHVLVDSALRKVVAQMGPLTDALSAGRAAVRPAVVAEHFLFTLVGVVVDAGSLTTFAIGDGVLVTNGVRRALGPFPDNAPPYLGYALLHDAQCGLSSPRVHETLSLEAVETVVLGTDGALDLEAAQPLDAFARDERVFSNRDHLRRRLTVLSRERALPDDTTVLVLRRAPNGGA